MNKRSRIVASHAFLAMLALVFPAYSQGLQLIYEEDFATEPGWNTNDPANLMWDSATQTYQAVQSNSANGTFAFHKVSWSGQSFRLEWDLRVNSVQWSAGATFGLFDPQMLYSNRSVTGDFSLVDCGYVTSLVANPTGSTQFEDTSCWGWQTGIWYRNVIEYDAATGALQMEVRLADTGQLMLTLSTTVSGSFPLDMDYIGVSRVHMQGLPNGATVDFNLDNIRFSVATACSPGIAAQLVASDAGVVTAYDLATQTQLWSVDIGSSAGGILIAPDETSAVVLVTTVDGQTTALDALTGLALWTATGSVGADEASTSDTYHQLYTNRVAYPSGPPRRTPGSAPSVLLLSLASPDSFATSLVNSRTGEVYWTRTEPSLSRGSGFIPSGAASYDVIFRANSGAMLRVDEATGATTIWSLPLTNRSAVPIPDITGDGEYDLFTRANFSQTMIWLDGLTGSTLFSVDYGSFDVLGATAVVGSPGSDADIIAAAQGSTAGGIRRYRSADGSVVWDSSSTYNNQTLRGLIRRASGGMTVLSGWRSNNRAVAIDAATGVALWDTPPTDSADFFPMGAALDLTGDGSEDVLSRSAGMLRLYDGVTGVEQSTFTPIPASGGAAIWVRSPFYPAPTPTCPGNLNGDGVVDGADLAQLLTNWGLCP